MWGTLHKNTLWKNTLVMMITMNPMGIATEDLAVAKPSVAISSAHHRNTFARLQILVKLKNW